MKRSTDRILTTHAGRLDGPPELMQLSRDVMGGRVADLNALKPQVQSGIVDVIRKQAQAGVDIISDGEVGKFGFGSLAYYGRRLSGQHATPRFGGLVSPGAAASQVDLTSRTRSRRSRFRQISLSIAGPQTIDRA